MASELARVRGFPLPKLEELAADFVRAAVMRSGDVDGDKLEQALQEQKDATAGQIQHNTMQLDNITLLLQRMAHPRDTTDI